MANAYQKAVRRSRRAIQDFQSAENADIRGDYTAVNSQLAAITANLQTAGKGIGANLTRSQQQTLRAVTRNTRRGVREGQASLRRTGRQMTRDYGSAIGGATGQSALATSRALLSGTKAIRAATVGGQSLLQRGGQQALALQKAGSREAAAGAEYATAVALKSRNQAAASQVAQMEFELQSMQLQHAQAIELAKLQHQQQLELFEKEKEEAEKEARPSWNQVYSAGGNIAGYFATESRYVQDPETGEWTKMSPAQMATQYGQSIGILDANGQPTSPDALNQMQLIQEVAKNIEGGMSANEATRAAMVTLYGDEKGFKVDKVTTSVRSGTRSAHFQFVRESLQQLVNDPNFEWAPGQAAKFANILRSYDNPVYERWADEIAEYQRASASNLEDGSMWGYNTHMKEMLAQFLADLGNGGGAAPAATPRRTGPGIGGFG